MNRWSDEETDEPLVADHRNFYKVQKWTKDGSKVDSLLFAGSNLGTAQAIFAAAIKHRPHGRACWTTGRGNKKGGQKAP